MKVGVVTFWHGDSNYGQILQCWALQSILRRLGHEPFIIRFIPQNYQSTTKKILKKILPINKFKELRQIIFDNNSWKVKRQKLKNDRLRNFSAFREHYLKFSPLVYNSIEALRANPPEADCYITGSDQVWAQLVSNPNNHAFFLEFGEQEIKRISYAPSFAMTEYPEDLRPILGHLLQIFNAISVREYSGLEICRTAGIEAVKVLDPTFLLSADDYKKLSVVDKKGKYIFIYSLNIKSADEIRWPELKDMTELKGMTVKVTPASGYFECAELFGDNVEYQYSTPAQWLGNLLGAEVVITTSFHGIALSIILHRPFVYIPLEGKFASGNSRALDLLRDLNLCNRILTPENSYTDIVESQIDWDKTESLLNKQRKDSMDYIVNALNS